MKTRSSFALLLVGCALVMMSAFWGCDDDECPVCPGPVVTPTINNIWPNADGNRWFYEYSWRIWDQQAISFTDVNDVPATPSLDYIAGLLESQETGPNVTVYDRRYQLTFDSLITTGSGVIAQNLDGVVSVPPSSQAAAGVIDGDDAFLIKLLRARPDLSDGIEPLLKRTDPSILSLLSGTGERSPLQEPIDLGPTLLADGAWRKTSDWIGMYGDYETRLSWKYLEANLAVGHEFSYQLVPTLAGDAWMHVRVLRKVNVNTAAGSFTGALELLYLIDFGIVEFGGIDPPWRYGRPLDYGVIVYAPNYGPVYSYERNLAYVGVDTVTAGYGDRTLLLLDGNLIEE